MQSERYGECADDELTGSTGKRCLAAHAGRELTAAAAVSSKNQDNLAATACLGLQQTAHGCHTTSDAWLASDPASWSQPADSPAITPGHSSTSSTSRHTATRLLHRKPDPAIIQLYVRPGDQRSSLERAASNAVSMRAASRRGEQEPNEYSCLNALRLLPIQLGLESVAEFPCSGLQRAAITV